MADQPIRAHEGKTPLQAANTANMDGLAQRGTCGSVRTIPVGFHPGSDVANLSILGYDPREYYTGRAPLEAASMGIDLNDDDVAFRCNLVTLKLSKSKDRAMMEDYSAGHIGSDEAREIIVYLDEELGSDEILFHSGISYRHLMVWKKGETNLECIPPHDIIGKEITEYLPCGKKETVIRSLMERSVALLNNHPVNRKSRRYPLFSINITSRGHL
jgi:2,3-bisphosphoglycerate-independent phosphoglycerate mutase